MNILSSRKNVALLILVAGGVLPNTSHAVKRTFAYDWGHLADYLPAGDAKTEAESSAWLIQNQDKIVYGTEDGLDKRVTTTTSPILPFQLFGVLYEHDFIVETNNPEWSMHEFAQVKFGDDLVWIAKDSDADGVQTVNSDLPKLDEWVPEVAIPRHSTVMKKDESKSNSKYMVVHLQYTNSKLEDVVVDFSSKIPAKTQTKRNGSTFNHSAQVVSALLDIQQEQQAKTTVTVSYDKHDGKGPQVYPARKVLGLVPVRSLLEQTQGGFAVSSMKITDQTGGFTLLRPATDNTQHWWPTNAHETWTTKNDHVKYTDKQLTSWDYYFPNGEFLEGSVSIPSRPDVPLTNLKLSATLPDLGRPFKGRVIRNFIMRINNQIHGYGVIEAEWIGPGAKIYITPLAPNWFAARPMETLVLFDAQGNPIISSYRVPTPQSLLLPVPAAK